MHLASLHTKGRPFATVLLGAALVDNIYHVVMSMFLAGDTRLTSFYAKAGHSATIFLGAEAVADIRHGVLGVSFTEKLYFASCWDEC